MRKKLSLMLCLLALACLLCVSVHAEEPVVVEQTCTGIIQSGGLLNSLKARGVAK